MRAASTCRRSYSGHRRWASRSTKAWDSSRRTPWSWTSEEALRPAARKPRACSVADMDAVSDALPALPAVERLDVAHGARLAAHHDRVRARAIAHVVHAFQQLAGRDARRGKRHVVGGHQIVHSIDAVEVHAVRAELRALLLGARPHLAQDLPADALDGGSGEHSLWRTANPHVHIHRLIVFHRGLDRGGHLAVLNQAHARARRPPAVDALFVAGGAPHRGRGFP